jgi:DNA-sulfur modification-associated
MSTPNISHLPPSPDSISSLSHAFKSADSSTRPFNVLTGINLGNNTFLLSVPMHQFFEMSAVANKTGLEEQGIDGPVAQRKLDPTHAQKLAQYILKGLVNTVVTRYNAAGTEIPTPLVQIQKKLGKQPYISLQPMVANLRPPFCAEGGVGLQWKELSPGVITVWLGDNNVLWVIDGQHRRYALDLVFEFLSDIKRKHDYPKRPALYPQEKGEVMSQQELAVWMDVYEVARTGCRIMVEVHLGLDSDQERQLFHDLNNLGKKVDKGVAFVFDSSNPINLFIKEELVDGKLIEAEVVEKDIVDWHNDPGAIAWKDLTGVNSLLFLNKTNISGAQPSQVEERKELAREFWETINSVEHFGKPQARKKTVAAQPVVLKAFAKLVYDFAFGRDRNPQLLSQLISGIPKLDLSHQNPMWRYYEMTALQRDSSGLTGLSEYLPEDQVDGNSGVGANRDIGRFDPTEHVMRFGAKHNDIYPLIGDMVRWRLKLPSRHISSPTT